jgi:riboflavin kinase/FMN adenylyltransferase
MQYIEGLKEYTDTGKSAVTFGKFDGLHRGHQKLVENVKTFQEQQGVKSALCAFDMSGRQVLMTKEERKERLENVDYLINCPFSDEFRHMEAEEFISKIIKGVFHADYVVVGTDFHFGYGQKGDADLLKAYTDKYDYHAVVVEKERYHGREISSTYIKEVVQDGDMKLAETLLGYRYGVNGIVEHGRQLGRTLGFPTMNVVWPKEKLLPPCGVYVSRINVDGIWYNGVSNIGRKPTVSNGEQVLVESYLFGYTGDAYGKKFA